MSSTTVNGASRESWWTQTIHQLTGQSKPDTTTQPSQSGDRVALSGKAPPSRDKIRQQASGRFGQLSGLTEALSLTSRTIDGMGHGGSRLLRGVTDFLGRGFEKASGAAASAEGKLTRAGTRLAGAGLDLVGAPRAADRLRRAGDTASKLLERDTRRAGGSVSNFLGGIGDGAGSLVEGVGSALAHPVRTLQALEKVDLVVNPSSQLRAVLEEGHSPTEVLKENLQTVSGIVDGFREGYRETGRSHGTAGQLGRALFDVVTTVATGGSEAAGSVGVRASANLLDDFARASRAAAAGGHATDVGRLAGSAGEFVGKRLTGPLAPLGERLTGAAESGSQALVRRAEKTEAQNLARGRQRSLEEGAVPGADGAQILGPSRQRAQQLSDQLRRDQRQFEAGGSEREAVLEELPGPTQQRVQDLSASGRHDEALEILQRHHVEEAIRSSLEEAAQVDKLYPTELPPHVDPSRVLARGRRESLEYLLNDANLPADGLRRNFRHIVGDSDVTGPVFLQEFQAGEQVGRAFSSSAGRHSGIGSSSKLEGGYFGSVDDGALSRSQIQQRNAIGLNNHADRFAAFTLPEDTYAVVSRIGEQFDLYGHHAVGGNMQYTFPGLVQPADPWVSHVGRLSSPAQRSLDAVVATGETGNIDHEA